MHNIYDRLIKRLQHPKSDSAIEDVRNMIKIILQPTRKDQINDAEDIIDNLDLAEYKQFFDASEYIELNKIYKDGKASFWSITPNKKVNAWERIEPGDIVLFYQNKEIVATATITFKLHNADLGSELNDPTENGEIYEYFYFFNNVKNQNISIKDFNEAAGYSENNVIQQFTVLDKDRSKKILNAFPPEIRPDNPTDNPPPKFEKLLSAKHQIILYGPPGTGKTYNARKFAVEFIAREIQNV